uniref:C2H2-type domain-containing protein n=2 Tax=Caenorhabditis tropicalis TaxID=1561998 RepID=A0A1I7U215_9PELO
MFDVMVGTVAGDDDGTDLKKKVLQKLEEDESWTTGSSESFEQAMRQVTAQFVLAQNKKHKITILSVVANSIPYLTVAKYIPNLSRYMYDSAKIFARRNNVDKFESSKGGLVRYDRMALQVFIDFITRFVLFHVFQKQIEHSSSVMIGLPYGYRNVKLSDGTKQQIPDTIRQQSSTEIFEMYNKMLKNSNQEHLALSRSSVFKILDVCAATDRRATTCVDYFTANGMEGFDGLHRIVAEWMNSEPTYAEMMRQIKKELFEASQYLRTDFRLHVKKCSRVADHCATLALSDPNDKKMSSSCLTDSYKHKYDSKCDRCERAKAVLKEISSFATDLMSETAESDPNWQKRKEDHDLIEKYVDEIQEMKKHYLRAAYTSQEREDILNNLSDNSALITIDFAQKYLPRWHREKQNDYFGKKGISYHISHVAAKISGTYTQHSFVHVFDSQDSSLVVLTLLHVLSQLKKVGITTVSLRSDNAGAYHCANTINSLHYLMEETGVKIDTYTFSEAQNGKSSSDRDASRVKRKAEEYVSNGNDITTSAQFFDSLKAGKMLNGMSIHHGSVTVDLPGNAKWTGISNLNHFTVEKEGIRGRRYGGIGEGHLVTKDNLNPMNGTFEFEDAGYTASAIESIESETKNVAAGKRTKFWYHHECKSNKENPTPGQESSNCINEENDTAPETDDGENAKLSDELGQLYSCPEVGCAAEFLTHYNLKKHLLRGKHKISPERFTLRDAAFKLFAKNIKEIQTSRTCSTITDALDELKESKEQDSLKPDWALPRKQTRKPFETKVKKFLVKCFEEGLLKKRLDPKFVEKRMITEKNEDGSFKFSVDERKDFRQIAGFFSREAEKRRNAGIHRHRRHVSSVDEVYEIPEEEHEDAGLIRFLKDESFFTEYDEYFQSVQIAKDIFTA